jgi:HlyD family secretion protein
LGFLGFAAYRLLPSVQQAFVAIARIRAHRAAFANIAADLRLGLAAVRPPEPEETLLAEWRGRPSSCVALREISFRYSDHTPLVLDRASAELAAGRITGLVGQNGAGKSTLADLLLGLLRPTCGNIVVDGVTLGEREVPAWRATVAYVPQQIVLLDATLVENIAFAVPAGEIDPDRVHAAARAARLDALIAGHPDGLDQRLGERGVHLSAGQRQRVGIARALYHGASMLVLDEATSALDAATERDLIATLRALRGEVTVVIIAHHESTLRVCDEIYELAGGALLARGGFDEWRDRTGSRRRVATP